MLLSVLIVCASIIIVVGIISYSCVKFYSLDTVRAFVNLQEKNRNLLELMRQKDSEYASSINNRDKECERLNKIVQSLIEKQKNYSIDANIKT